MRHPNRTKANTGRFNAQSNYNDVAFRDKVKYMPHKRDLMDPKEVFEDTLNHEEFLERIQEIEDHLGGLNGLSEH